MPKPTTKSKQRPSAFRAPPARPVRSSNIDSVAYDEDARVMTVAFLNNTTYRYADVPPAVAADLFAEIARADAEVPGASVGRAFHRLIRATYPGERLV